MRSIAAVLCMFSLVVHAEPFPSRPVHLIVPYTPGTGADILARVLGPKLGERWKVAVVTENKPGATGNIGAGFVAKSAADGHTLLMAATSFTTTSSLWGVVNPRLPAQSMRELIEAAKRAPGKLHYGSPGNGGVQHLAMELLELDAGVDLVHVQAGRLRMLGQLEVETWYAVFAPAGTPASAVAKLNADFDALLQDAQMRELLARQGMTAAGGAPQRLAQLVRRELARWARVVKLAGIKAD